MVMTDMRLYPFQKIDAMSRLLLLVFFIELNFFNLNKVKHFLKSKIILYKNFLKFLLY